MPESEPATLRHYTLRHRVISWVSRRLCDRFTYTVRHGLLKSMRRKGGLGFLPAWLSGNDETAEAAFWRGLCLEGWAVYDIGAFQGLLTLYFARRARAVVSYEPNSRNRRRLLENLELNRIENVTVRDVGIGAREHTASLIWDSAMPGGGSVDPDVSGGIAGVPHDSEEIRITTLDRDIEHHSLPPPDLLKIDIEGHELAALEGARQSLLRYRPALFLEMHGETWARKEQNVAAIVAWLEAAGYGDIRHVETGSAINAGNCARAREGHLYCARPAYADAGEVTGRQTGVRRQAAVAPG